MSEPEQQPIGRIDGGSARKSRSKSVFYCPQDVEQCVPSLPVVAVVDELKTKHGKTLFAEEFIRLVEEADENSDGLISVEELVHVIEGMHNVKKENTNLRKYLWGAVAVLLLVLCAIFGLVFAVVKLTQEVSTGGASGNALVSKTTGIIVDTHPSDGGGIYLDMAAFTEPVNVTFHGFDKTQECVGQVSVDQIDQHYTQFTTGGSDLTLRHVDYSREGQPVVYTVIPASSLEVTGFGTNEAVGMAAQEATIAIKNTEAQFGSDPEGRRRHLSAAITRLLQNENAQNVQNEKGTVVDDNTQGACTNGCNSGSTPRNNAEVKGPTMSRGGGKGGRRLQEEELVTVGDYMQSFAEQSIAIVFTKDHELSDEVYFVCMAAEATE